ncbi:hypothetical protein BAE35_04825 [Chlamydia psittaci]|nr:hypothetical protein [Chlamydia psittaci]ODJ00294.1 hypothetical protein BAE35_04825 [Chlamydia psittaci]
MTLPDKISSSHSSRNQSDSFAYHSETSHQNTWPSSNGSSDITLYNSLIKRNNTAEDVVKIGAMIQESIRNDLKKKSWGGGGGRDCIGSYT